MKFKSKQEQYEWWTETISKIQSHHKSIRAGCCEVGIQFWQYYEWKERVQQFIDQGKVSLPPAESSRSPKGPKPGVRESRSLSFVEITNSIDAETQPLTLYFNGSWRLDIPEGFNPSTLTSVLKALEAL